MHARARAHLQIPRKHGKQRQPTSTQASRRDQKIRQAQLVHQQLAEPVGDAPDHIGERHDRLPEA